MDWMVLAVISVLVPIAVVVLILFAMRRTIFGPSKKQQEQASELVTTGRKARATILRVDPTGMVVNNINIQCWVTFRLDPLDGGPAFEGRKKMLINQTRMPRAGDVWPAWVSPTDQSLFAVGMPDGASPDQVPLYREFGIAHPLDPTTAAAPDPPDDTVAELARLAEMKAQGLLSDAEFAAAKAKVLGGPS